MKVKTYKKTNKHFEDIYTKKKETKEVEIELEKWMDYKYYRASIRRSSSSSTDIHSYQ